MIRVFLHFLTSYICWHPVSVLQCQLNISFYVLGKTQTHCINTETLGASVALYQEVSVREQVL